MSINISSSTDTASDLLAGVHGGANKIIKWVCLEQGFSEQWFGTTVSEQQCWKLRLNSK